MPIQSNSQLRTQDHLVSYSDFLVTLHRESYFESMKKQLSCFLIAITLVLGCSDDSRPGSLEFDWRLGSQGCEAYGVVDVEASLYAFSQVDPMYATTLACADGRGSISDIEMGEYTFLLAGRDINGCVTHEARTEVAVGSGQMLSLDRPLALLRRVRPLELTWNFANQLDCTGNEIEQVEIVLEVADVVSHTEIRACEGFKTIITSEIQPNDISIAIFGINTSGQRTLEGRLQVARDEFFESPCEPYIRGLVILDSCSVPSCEL